MHVYLCVAYSARMYVCIVHPNTLPHFSIRIVYFSHKAYALSLSLCLCRCVCVCVRVRVRLDMRACAWRHVPVRMYAHVHACPTCVPLLVCYERKLENEPINKNNLVDTNTDTNN
jgi:hypothetical protein